jgi:phytoene synthase
MWALYAFARITDDIGDGQAPLSTRIEYLNRWRELLALHCSTQQGNQSRDEPAHASELSDLHPLREFDPLWPALRACVSDFQIPGELLDDIVYGVTMDLTHRPPNNWEELHRYAYHVASAVGLACTHIWCSDQTIPRQTAIDCGVAFQLTNILRDVAEDARMGRRYIPTSVMVDYDVDSSNWISGLPTGRWREMIDHVADEAIRLYISGWPTIDALTPDSQRMFSLIWRTYRSLLDQIRSAKDSLWLAPKISLPHSTRLSLLTTHLVPQLFSRLPAP